MINCNWILTPAHTFLHQKRCLEKDKIHCLFEEVAQLYCLQISAMDFIIIFNNNIGNTLSIVTVVFA